APATADDEEAGRHTDLLAPDLAGGVRALASRAGVTPYLVFATALAALTHPGDDERRLVLLGTLIAQRDRPEWQRIVGPLLNVSVLAIDLDLASPVPDALAATRDAALRAYRCANLPFQELVPHLTPAPGGDGSPFDVMLVMQPPGGPVAFTGLDASVTDVDTGAAPYPLLVDIEERDGGYQVSYRYQASRFDPVGVAELAGRMRALVRALGAAGDRSLAELVPAGWALPAERS
ncbi:condensation domain-containing protein, partial [Actinophytocola sp.]|uniref:condensation domain-containing protein n=1 Tax=Actinophytocola sp. TaxID=1872138 RepID=UPI003D6B6DE0